MMTVMQRIQGFVSIAFSICCLIYIWRVLRGPNPDYEFIIPTFAVGVALGGFFAIRWRIRNRQSKEVNSPKT
jgi:hypothetical protein